jgi:hypothetical protein
MQWFVDGSKHNQMDFYRSGSRYVTYDLANCICKGIHYLRLKIDGLCTVKEHTRTLIYDDDRQVKY